jgi:hypothetical protein
MVEVVELVRSVLLEEIPLFGICFGQLLLGLGFVGLYRTLIYEHFGSNRENLMKMIMAFAIAAAAFAAVPATATSITVVNPSFEQTPVPYVPLGCAGPTNACVYTANGIIPGWTTSGVSGIFRPELPERYNAIPDGVTVAYTDGGASIEQNVGLAEAGKIYTLKAFVGDRNDLVATQGSVKLIVGANTVLATGITPLNGFWSEFTATYASQLADVGQSIIIRLESPGAAQGNFDHVTLSSAVPEPTTWAMLILGFGMAGSALRRRRVALTA